MKTIKELLGEEIVSSNVNLLTEVRYVQTASKAVQKGDIFVALKGEKNGAEYCVEAINNGAVAVVAEEDVIGVPLVRVADTRKALALMAGRYYDEAYKRISFIGVVGTNGKTTSTYIAESVLTAAGKKVAVVGTLGMVIGESSVSGVLTTPDPMDLHAFISDASEKGVTHIVMEISAHAIYYKKTYGIIFDVCIFTNLSQDHLDFFGTMEKYGEVKRGFFTDKNVKTAVVNVDDACGLKIAAQNIPVFTYGLENPSDVFALNIEKHGEGMRFVLNAFDELAEIYMPLRGVFNVYNALGVIAAMKILGVNMSDIISGMEGIEEISGRFNVIGCDVTVIIDYAHTPDGLANVLKAARQIGEKKLICVFGCGGNRDKGKRGIMGGIAAEYCDKVVITSDNPRFEDPSAIIKDVKEGIIGRKTSYSCITDRKNAISYAVKNAEPGDVIVIAGKGGEDYIDVMGKKYPYSDKLVAEAALRRYRNYDS